MDRDIYGTYIRGIFEARRLPKGQEARSEALEDFYDGKNPNASLNELFPKPNSKQNLQGDDANGVPYVFGAQQTGNGIAAGVNIFMRAAPNVVFWAVIDRITVTADQTTDLYLKANMGHIQALPGTQVTNIAELPRRKNNLDMVSARMQIWKNATGTMTDYPTLARTFSLQGIHYDIYKNDGNNDLILLPGHAIGIMADNFNAKIALKVEFREFEGDLYGLDAADSMGLTLSDAITIGRAIYTGGF